MYCEAVMKVRLLSPVRCGICGYHACYNELPVCSRCVNVLQTLITMPCKKCGRPSSACACANNDNLRFLFFFRGPVAHKLIYRLKYRGDDSVLAFMAELAVFACGINPAAFDGVTFVPRSKKNRKLYGYDQSKVMAKAISEKYGIPFVDILERTGGNDQKLLSRSERLKNIKNNIRLKNIPSEKYKKLLLVDDIYTTGASIASCAELLRGSAAKSVVPMTVAKTENVV